MTDEISREALHDILRGVAALTGDAIVADLARLVGKGVRADISIAFNPKQIASKRWLGETLAQVLPEPDGPVWVLGAWHGVLGAMLLAEDARVDLDFQRSDTGTRVTVRHTGVPAAWREDLALLWRWDVVRFAEL